MATLSLTVSSLLYLGYRYAGILRGPMRGLSASEQQEGVMLLNAVIDSLKAERGAIYSITQNTVPINANQQVYTIGLDITNGPADWQLPRPETIPRAGFLWTNVNPVVEEPFEIYTDQQWAALSPKELQGNIPYILYYQPTTPNGIVNVWPIPTSNWQATLYLWNSVDYVQGPDDTLFMPPGYDDALAYGLAVKLAPLYPQFPMHPTTMQQYINAKSRIRARNWVPLLMQSEMAARGISGDNAGRWRIWSNDYL